MDLWFIQSAALPRWHKWVIYGLFAGLLCLVFSLFFHGTTFLGDDHLFRTFARFTPNPWIAFYEDKHGGEYYRPLPMLFWWLLERLSAGRTWPFALFAWVLHTLCAWQLAQLARHLNGPRNIQWMAALLFFFSPAQLEAALWFSASTDLLCTTFILTSITWSLAPSRQLVIGSWICAGLALVSKETAIVLPILILVGFCFSQQAAATPWSRLAMRAIPYLSLTVFYVVVRFLVLGGMGGTHDPKAGLMIRGIQVVAGLCHAVVGYAPWPEALLLLLGFAALTWAGWQLQRSNRLMVFAWVFVGLSIMLLPFAGWVVGARYFYLAGAGLALIFASLLAVRSLLIFSAVLSFFLLQNYAVAQKRVAEIRRYEKTVATAKVALVSTMMKKGTRIFILRGAVKDLDLAVKLDPKLPVAIQQIVVIPDVPASFIRVPADYSSTLRFLLASPPLPPDGAYRWGHEQIVGLARREEAPDLDDVYRQLPNLALLQLETTSDGAVIWKDRTNQLHDP